MIKLDRTVRNFTNRIGRVGERAFFGQHFGDTFGGFPGHGNHYENHRNHHQTVENHKAVGQQRRKLADVQIDAACGDDRI